MSCHYQVSLSFFNFSPFVDSLIKGYKFIEQVNWFDCCTIKLYPQGFGW